MSGTESQDMGLLITKEETLRHLDPFTHVRNKRTSLKLCDSLGERGWVSANKGIAFQHRHSWVQIPVVPPMNCQPGLKK